jgi:hypothetical protein
VRLDFRQELAAVSCKEFLLTLRDGTTHAAYVRFR